MVTTSATCILGQKGPEAAWTKHVGGIPDKWVGTLGKAQSLRAGCSQCGKVNYFPQQNGKWCASPEGWTHGVGSGCCLLWWCILLHRAHWLDPDCSFTRWKYAGVSSQTWGSPCNNEQIRQLSPLKCRCCFC